MGVVTKTKSKEDGACKKCPPAHAKLCTSFEAMCGRAQGFVDEETRGREDIWKGQPRFQGNQTHEKNLSSFEVESSESAGKVNTVLGRVGGEENDERLEVLEGVNKRHVLELYWDYQKSEYTWEELAEKHGYNSVHAAEQAFYQQKHIAMKMEELYELLECAKPLAEAARNKRQYPIWFRNLLLTNCFPEIPAKQLARFVGEDPGEFNSSVQYGLRKISQGAGIRIYHEDGVLCVGETKSGGKRIELPLRPDIQTQISMN